MLEKVAVPTVAEETTMLPAKTAADPRRRSVHAGEDTAVEIFRFAVVKVLAVSQDATSVGVACVKAVKTVGFVVLV